MPSLFVVCCILIDAHIDCFPVPLLCTSMDCHSIHGNHGYTKVYIWSVCRNRPSRERRSRESVCASGETLELAPSLLSYSRPLYCIVVLTRSLIY